MPDFDTDGGDGTGGDGNGGGDNGGTPGFELLTLLAAVAVVLILFRKKK
jgi:hypothetical protein